MSTRLQKDARAYMRANPGVKYTEARRIMLNNYKDRLEAEREASEDDDFYSDGEDAMSAPMTPKTPCRIIETRPCVDAVDPYEYPISPCSSGYCARYDL